MSATEQDARIETLTEQEFDTPGEALAAATEVSAIINSSIAAEQQRVGDVGTLSALGGDLGDKLRKWLDKLEQLVKKIAAQFGALSYSLTVGWPLGVSVTITWSPPS